MREKGLESRIGAARKLLEELRSLATGESLRAQQIIEQLSAMLDGDPRRPAEDQSGPLSRDLSRYQRALAVVRAHLADPAPNDKIIADFLDVMVEQFDLVMAWFGELKDSQLRPRLSAGRVDRYLDDLVLPVCPPKDPKAQCAISLAILNRKPFSYSDLAHDEGFSAWRDYALELGYRSNLALPLTVEGEVRGGIMVYDTRTHAFPEERIQYLAELVEELGTVISTVSERQRARAALTESERRYRTLLDNSLVGVFRTNLEGEFLYANQAMAEIAGFGHPGELLGLRAGTFWGNPSRREEFVARLRTKGRVSSFEVEGRRRQGEMGTVLISASLQGDFIDGMILDITERKLAEEELRKSEARYRAVVEEQSELVTRFRPETWELTFVNGATCRAFGKGREELLGRSLMPYVAPQQRGGLVSLLRSLSPADPVGNIEHQVVLPGGETRWQQWSNRAIFDERGRLVEYQAVGRDITERKRAEEELRRANEELERLSRAKDEFLSLASHELKTPVTSIKLFSELITRRPETFSPDLLGRLTRQADQLTSLINDLLDLSRLQLGKMPVDKRPVDLAPLLREACQRRASLCGQHIVNCPEASKRFIVAADPVRLEQVFTNLLDNAHKYTPAGRHIWMRVGSRSGHVLVEIADEGIGITPEHLPHIFERFYKPGPQQAVYSGLGVGLYISKEIVERHGGRIWAESGGEGKGSRFLVEFPLAGGREPASAGAPGRPRP